MDRIVRTTSLIVFLLALARTGDAGTIAGTLTVPAVSSGTSANPYPGRASALPGRHEVPHGLVTDAVVYVEQIPAKAESLLVEDPSGRLQPAARRMASVRLRALLDFLREVFEPREG